MKTEMYIKQNITTYDATNQCFYDIVLWFYGQQWYDNKLCK